MTWPPDNAPCIADGVLTFSPSDGSDTVVFDDDARRWYRLPDTAAAIWAAIDGDRSVASIIKTLAAAYEIEPVAIERDVRDLLAGLVDRGLLVDPGI